MLSEKAASSVSTLRARWRSHMQWPGQGPSGRAGSWMRPCWGCALRGRRASVQHPTPLHPTSAHSPSHGRSSPCWPLTLGGIKNNFANILEKSRDNFAEKYYFCLFFYGSVQCPAWHGRTIGYWESLGNLIKLALLFHRPLAKLQKNLHP